MINSTLNGFKNEDVFVSYSSKDEAVAKNIKALLEAPPRSVTCWMANDVTISAGDDFRNRIVDALRRCKVFLLILSKSSIESKWCPLELSHAIMENKKIYTIRIDDTPLNDEFKFKLGCSQISDGTINYDAAVESLGINVKNGRDQVIELEKTRIANIKKHRAFGLRCLAVFNQITLIQWIISIIISIIVTTKNGGLFEFLSSSQDTPDSSLFLYSFGTLLALTPIMIVTNAIFSMKMKRLNNAASMDSPSAHYCLYQIHYYHNPIARLFARKRILWHLERSAELQYEPAIDEVKRRSKNSTGSEE